MQSDTTASTALLKLELTKHALQRLLERRPRQYKKLNPQVIMDVLRNVVLSGKLARFQDQLWIISSRYCLICIQDPGNKLIVKTVLNPRELSWKPTQLIKIPWRSVAITTPSYRIQRWIQQISSHMKTLSSEGDRIEQKIQLPNETDANHHLIARSHSG